MHIDGKSQTHEKTKLKLLFFKMVAIMIQTAGTPSKKRKWIKSPEAPDAALKRETSQESFFLKTRRRLQGMECAI